MNEAKEALQICLATLPDDQREAIDRHCLQGQSLQEAAEAMNRTPGAIRALVHRGKAKLREEIASSAIFSRRH